MTNTIIASDTTWGEYFDKGNVGVTYPEPGPSAAQECHHDDHDGQEDGEEGHQGHQVRPQANIPREHLTVRELNTAGGGKKVKRSRRLTSASWWHRSAGLVGSVMTRPAPGSIIKAEAGAMITQLVWKPEHSNFTLQHQKFKIFPHGKIFPPTVRRDYPKPKF